MPPRKLTAGEQALLNKWVPWQFYFLKMMRRANRYLINIPNEIYIAAYKEVSNSGLVAGPGGELDKPRHRDDKSYWDPKPQDREAYVKYIKDFIDRHPITSPYNAVVVFFAGNGGCSCVENRVFMYKSQRAEKKFWNEVHKLNNADREEVMKNEELIKCNNPGSVNNNAIVTHVDILARDPNERPIDYPFVRPKPIPGDIKISESNWHRYENIRQTFFVKDEDDETGCTAFELAGILILETGKFYRIRYEDNVDSIEIPQKELFEMFGDGTWV